MKCNFWSFSSESILTPTSSAVTQYRSSRLSYQCAAPQSGAYSNSQHQTNFLLTFLVGLAQQSALCGVLLSYRLSHLCTCDCSHAQLRVETAAGCLDCDWWTIWRFFVFSLPVIHIIKGQAPSLALWLCPETANGWADAKWFSETLSESLYSLHLQLCVCVRV